MYIKEKHTQTTVNAFFLFSCRTEATACLLNWFGRGKSVRRKTEQLIHGRFYIHLVFPKVSI